MGRNAADPAPLKRTGYYISVDPEDAIRRREQEIRSLINDFWSGNLADSGDVAQETDAEVKDESKADK